MTATVLASNRLSKDAPWPGLRPFNEGEQDFFFGRNREIDDLRALILRSPVVVLYGQSGLGKTSVLHAGLFSKLKAINLLPFSLRFDHRESAPSFADQLKTALTAQLDAAAVDAPRPSPNESLWEYFHRRDVEFWGPRNRLLTPTIVLDQFEEMFTLGQRSEASGARVARFVDDLEALLEHRPPDHVRLALDRNPEDALQYDLRRQNVKLVFTLREDFLAHLDTWRTRIPSLLPQRYRLERMTAAQAIEVVQGAGNQLVSPDVVRGIVEFVSGSQRQRTGVNVARLDVEPALLSLVCYELNRRRIDRGQSTITADLLSAGGEIEQIIQSFYDAAFWGLDPGVRVWIEEELLTASGHRDRAALEDAERAGIPLHAMELLEQRRIIHSEERDGCVWLELTHDLLADPAVQSRDARRRRKELESAALVEQQHQLRIRDEIARPTENAVQSVCEAADQLLAALVAGTGISSSGASRAADLAYIALAAEVLCDHGRFDLATEYVGRASGLLQELAEHGDDVPVDALTSAQAQCKYVLAYIADETRELAAAAEHGQHAVSLASSVPDGPSRADSIRINFLAQIRLAGISYRRGHADDARRRLQHVLNNVKTDAGQIGRDEVDAWTVAALQSLSLAQESQDAAQTLERAETVLLDLIAADPANRRWKRLHARIAADRGQMALELRQTAEANRYLKRSLAASRELTDSNPQDLGWTLCLVEALYSLAQLDTGNSEWDSAFEALSSAEQRCAAILENQPNWTTAAHEAAIIQWHIGELLQARAAKTTDASARVEILKQAAARYEKGRATLENALKRVPDNVRLVRGIALFVGQIGALGWASGDLESALARYSEALASLGTLEAPVRATRHIQDVDVYFLDRIGDLLVKTGDATAAIARYTEAAEIRLAIALASTDASLHFEYLSALYEKIAEAQSAAGRPAEADAAYQQAVSAVERALVASGSTEASRQGSRSPTELLRLRASLKQKLSLVWADMTANDRALPTLREAATAWLEFWDQVPWDKKAQENLQQLRQRATQLGATDVRNYIDRALELLPDAVEVRNGVRVAIRPQNWVFPPLMPGVWRTLGADAQLRELARLKAAATAGAAAVIATAARPAGIDSIRRLRQLPLDCYDNVSLWEAEIQPEADRREIVTYCRGNGGTELLTGTAPCIYLLNANAGLRLDTPERATAYLLLFVNALQADSGRFAIVENAANLSLSPSTPAELRLDLERSIRPLVLNRGDDGGWTASATVQYDTALFYASFQVTKRGFVDMGQDAAFAARLPLYVECFLGGSRTLLPGQDKRVEAHIVARGKQWGEAASAIREWADFVDREYDAVGFPKKQLLLTAYDDLTWYLLLNRDFSNALDAAERRVAVGGANAASSLGRAHALLFLNRSLEAEELYQAYFKVCNRAGWRGVVEELDEFEQNGLTHPEFARLGGIARSRSSE